MSLNQYFREFYSGFKLNNPAKIFITNLLFLFCSKVSMEYDFEKTDARLAENALSLKIFQKCQWKISQAKISLQ
jgi:hypothetical protein